MRLIKIIKNLNSNNSLIEDRRSIREKKFLNQIYKDFYMVFKKTKVPGGKLVEIGSGAGFIKQLIPSVITSDVLKGPDINKVFFAEKMPFKNSSIAAFFMIDVLHHIKDPEQAFIEMARCLKRRGKIIMIEPFNSLWGGFIYKYLHHEHFDPNEEWKIRGKGRMSDSNTALPWIIFIRDRNIFEEKFPNLKIKKVEGHSPFRYLFSGGLSKHQFVPTFTYPVVRFIEEKLLSLFANLIGMFVTIELEKIN